MTPRCRRAGSAHPQMNLQCGKAAVILSLTLEVNRGVSLRRDVKQIMSRYGHCPQSGHQCDAVQRHIARTVNNGVGAVICASATSPRRPGQFWTPPNETNGEDGAKMRVLPREAWPPCVPSLGPALLLTNPQGGVRTAARTPSRQHEAMAELP